MFCKTCGNQIPDGSTTCPSCGAAQVAQQYQQPVQQYQQVQPVQQPAPSNQTRVIPGFVILSILVPLFGIIFGIVNLAKKNTRPGRAYLIAGGVTFVVICMFVAIIVPTMLEFVESSRGYYNYYY